MLCNSAVSAVENYVNSTILSKYVLSCPNVCSSCHNDIRDLTAELMSEVCHNLSTGPLLLSSTDECFSLLTVNSWCLPRHQGFWLLGFLVSFLTLEDLILMLL